MAKLLEGLGVYGVSDDKEDAILASLLTGDPVLLIGKQGTAKTLVSDSIGRAFRESTKRRYPDDPSKWINYHAYDSSKINFEDLIGFPDPSELLQGRSAFIRSPLTIWDKDLVCFDEFNRQLPERQNNLFEIIRSRRIMGLPTKVKWIINAMNPFGMAGTEQLDEALVDRHQWFIFIDSYDALTDEHKKKVAVTLGSSDGVGLRFWSESISSQFDASDDVTDGKPAINHYMADIGDQIFQLLERAASIYNHLVQEKAEPYSSFVSRAITTLRQALRNKEFDTELSGRRAAMVFRALCAYRAIDLAKSEIDPRHEARSLKNAFRSAFHMTLPIGISSTSEKGVPAEIVGTINSTLDAFGDFFTTESTASIDVMYELMTTKSMARKISILMDGSIVDEVTKNHIWDGLLKDDGKDSYQKIRSSVLLACISHISTLDPSIVPKNFQKHVATKGASAICASEICKNLTVSGPIAYFHKEISDILSGISDPFVRLQAALLFEDSSVKHTSRISKGQFMGIAERISTECRVLEHVITKARDTAQKARAASSTTVAPPTSGGTKPLDSDLVLL